MEILGYVLSIPAAALSRGFVLATLWRWFVMRTFHVPALSIPVALGIGLIVGMLCRDGTPEDKSQKPWVPVIAAVVGPWLALALGWVFTWFM